MSQQMTPQQRKAMISQLQGDTKVKIDEAQFALQMKGMKIKEQEMKLRSQIIACEAAEGYLRMMDVAEEMSKRDLSFAGQYHDFAVEMLKKTAPDVEGLKRYMAEEEVNRAAQSLKKSGIILNNGQE